MPLTPNLPALAVESVKKVCSTCPFKFPVLFEIGPDGRSYYPCSMKPLIVHDDMQACESHPGNDQPVLVATNAEIILSLMRENGFSQILAIYGRPWTAFSTHRFGIDFLQEQGIHVVTTAPAASMEWFEQDHPPAHTLIYLLSPLSVQTWRLYHILTKLKYRCLVRHTGLLPAPFRRATPFLGSIKAWFSQRVTEFMVNHHNLFGIAPVDFFLGGGKASFSGSSPYPTGPSTRYLNGHAPDYDVYIELMKKGQMKSQVHKIAVFLDSDDFHHPDLVRMGGSAPLWEGMYYARLRRFFDIVEAIFGVHVIIAAHPLSTSTDTSRFGSREIIKGMTGDLVRASAFVIAHASTAINMAVLFWKPIIFITDMDYVDFYVGPLIESMAGALRKKPIYIDDPAIYKANLNTALHVDPIAYHRYIDEYIRGARGW